MSLWHIAAWSEASACVEHFLALSRSREGRSMSFKSYLAVKASCSIPFFYIRTHWTAFHSQYCNGSVHICALPGVTSCDVSHAVQAFKAKAAPLLSITSQSSASAAEADLSQIKWIPQVRMRECTPHLFNPSLPICSPPPLPSFSCFLLVSPPTQLRLFFSQ